MPSSTGTGYELLITPLPLDFAYGQGQAALKGLFERFGTIARAEIRSDGWHAFALVEFHSEFAALQAIYEVHGSFVCGTKVSVSWSEASLKSFRARYDIRVEQHPWTLDKSWLISLFARYGPTLIDVVDNPITTSSSAFAYVRFAQAEAAQRAIDERDGIVLGGAEVSVSWQWTLSRPGKELIVRFLPFDVSVRTVRDVFSGYGRLTNVDIARDRLSGEKIGIAYVQFLHELEAEQAMDALDGHVMSRGPIRITWARESRPSGHLIRVGDLAEIVDRKMLKPVFRRYGGLRCVEVDYDGLTGRSTRDACVTFADPEQVQAVLKYFGGYYLRNGEGVVSLPMGKHGESLRIACN
ncbi:polyadenylate-binding protein 4-like protein [Aphelenchoides avenae]|nr:polyadenylate-binding protein 4-like protein [Aphelenchus avenae]